MNIQERVGKYLKKQNIHKWKIKKRHNDFYNNFVVIPACDEFNYIHNLLQTLEINESEYLKKTLVVIVVNNSVNASKEVKNSNLKLINYLDKKISDSESSINLAYIDAASIWNQLDDKLAGVGFARKLGMDSSLKMIDFANNEKKLLISLDADCKVEKNYLKEIINYFKNRNAGAAVIKYEHIFPSDLIEREAIINYELFLRYYVLGLKYAKSPYAFHTIGSTFACDIESYIKTGGMNKKKGGEDFYFLQKLAKITNIDYIKSTKVYPSARVSNRVPFGTGPRIKKFIENKQKYYSIYSPKTFELLRSWLVIFMESNLIGNPEEIDTLLNESNKINSKLKDFLLSIDFKKDWKKIIKNSGDEKQIIKQKTMWFDGFKTLKFIHYFRDNCFPNQPFFESLNTMLKLNDINIDYELSNESPSLEIQENYLQTLREIT